MMALSHALLLLRQLHFVPTHCISYHIAPFVQVVCLDVHNKALQIFEHLVILVVLLTSSCFIRILFTSFLNRSQTILACVFFSFTFAFIHRLIRRYLFDTKFVLKSPFLYHIFGSLQSLVFVGFGVQKE